MDLTSRNAAYKSYIEQGKQAYGDGDRKRAKELFLRAADITNRIMIETKNPEVKSEYYNVTKTLLDFVKSDCGELNATNVPVPKTEPTKAISEPELSVEEALGKLHSLIGLDDVKVTVERWVGQIKVFKERKDRNLKTPEMSYHMVFTGNPGTGKTTVARIIGQIYRSLGILSKGHLVETDRSKLVAGYIGQTGPLTAKVIEQAKGGVLFIDEAYTLAQGGENDFGNEAIATLLKYMEDERSDFAVIVAGYEDLMNDFICANPGLKSRFKTYVKFNDYNPEQLYAIFEKLCEEADYISSEDLKDLLKSLFGRMYEKRDKNFGNGRAVRNLFEKIVTNQSYRISLALNGGNVSNEDMVTLTAEDARDLTEEIR